MAVRKDAMAPQLKALKTTDMSSLIRMAGVMLPRLLNGFMATLDTKQRRAFDEVMPVGGEKKIYLYMVGTPTPPIVIGLAQPPKMSTLSEMEVKQQQLRGIKLTIDDLQLLAGGRTLGAALRFVWRLKRQIFTILGILRLFWPFVRLGPAELQDLRNKATTRFKPLIDLLPHH